MPEGNGKGDTFGALDRVFDIGESVVGGMESLFGKKSASATERPATIEAAPTRVLDRGERELLQEVRLSPVQVAFLGMLEKRGGRIPWNWEKCRPADTANMVDMLNKRIVKEVEYVTHVAQAQGTLYVELTDQGRQCLVGLAKMQPKRLTSG